MLKDIADEVDRHLGEPRVSEAMQRAMGEDEDEGSDQISGPLEGLFSLYTILIGATNKQPLRWHLNCHANFGSSLDRRDPYRIKDDQFSPFNSL